MHRESSNKRTGGYVALWLLIAIALTALASLGVASLLQPDTVIPVAWVVGCVAVAAVGLAIEARHDSFDFLKIGGTFAAIGAAGCGLVATFGAGSHPLVLAGAIVLGLASATAFAGVYRMSRAEESIPNVLLERFARSQLAELGGVQFVATHSDLRVASGGELIVEVHAQNGMDAPRTLEVRLEPRRDIGKSGHLAFDKSVQLELPPGAAGTITIPVAVHPKARGTYRIGVAPRVTGRGGRRIRVYRARAFSQKVGGGMQAFALLFGFLVWGGGLTLPLKVARNKGWKNLPVDEPSPSSASLTYEPDRALLEGLRTRL